MTGFGQVTYHADHTLLLALPALAPAVVVAGVVLYIALRDRRTPDDPEDPSASSTSDEEGETSW